MKKLSLILLLLNIFNNNYLAQDLGPYLGPCGLDSIPPIEIVERDASCDASSTTFIQKYRTPEFWTAKDNTPVKTILVNIIACRKDDGTGGWIDTVALYESLDILFEKVNEIYSSPQPKGYQLTCEPQINYISDSKIRFKLNQVYFIDSTVFHFVPNSSSPSASFEENILQYIFDKHPEAVFQLNHIFTMTPPNQGPGYWGHYFYNTNLQTAYIHTFRSMWSDWYTHWDDHVNHLAHEYGHAIGLHHTYNSEYLNLSHYDYLNDVFGNCGQSGCCNPTAGNACYLCHLDTTNQPHPLMSGTPTQEYISPKQSGRMHRALSLYDENFIVNNKFVHKYVDETIPYEKSYIVTENETWDFSIKMYQNVIVKNGATLTITCEVMMPNNGKIIIEPGGRLIIDGGKITNFYTILPSKIGLWLGIDVQGNRTLHQTAANQGVVEMKNGAIIEYAKNGIRTIGTDENDIKDWSKTGGIVRIYDGTFRNCRRGIEFLSYANMNPTGNGQEMSNQSFIHNANFVTDEVLPNNVIPYAGLTMFEVRGIQIRNCNFENIRTDITTVPVDERGSGIYSIDANYKVTSGYNISTGNPIAGTGNEFSNLYYGVYTSGGTEWSDVTINDNDFANCAFGVGLTGANYATIGRNNFAIKGGNGTPTLFGQGFGVYTEGSYGFNIEQNTYTSLDPSGFPDQAVHVKQSSDIGTGKVYRNTITNTTYGTQTANNNESLKIDCNNYNKGVKSTIDIHNAIGDLDDQGECFFGGNPAKNLFSGTCNNTSLSQIYNNGNPFIYTYEGTTLDPNCTNLGTNAEPCNLPITNGCPPKLPNNVITPKPVRLSQVKGKIGIVKTDINSLKTNMEEGDSENLMTAIATQNTGNLKNTLMAKSPYLSDRVLNAYLTKPQQAPPGHIKEVVIANSPVTNEIKEVIDLMSLPNGIRNQINAAQVGISVRTELENQLKALDKERMLLIDEVVREYADTNWLDSAIVFLKDEGSISALCALVPMEVRKDTVSAKIHISSIRNEADNLEQRNPTDERIDAMRGFCNFHETLMRVKAKEGSYFNLSNSELLNLESLANSELAIAYNAKAILNFINEEIPIYQGYDAFFPKSMTLEESETLISSENYFDFKAYPNPSNGNVTFTLDEKMEGNKTIVITDLLGKVIRILPVNNPTINYEFINVPQGTYLAHLVMDGQIEKTIKVIYVE